MSHKKYSIFGGGAAGLYTAWRLLNGEAVGKEGHAKQLKKGDLLELFDWGKYDYSKDHKGSREPGARVCTWHYKDDKKNAYLELGGMRYSEWDGSAQGQGHRLVTTVIKQLGLDKYSVPFNESTNPLFYLRGKNMFLNQISSTQPAPYNANNYGASTQPDTGFSAVEALAVTAEHGPQTRRQWCTFFNHGRINVEMPESSIYKKGDLLKDIGYWNLMYDQLGAEGFQYTADGNGYSSNVINWNSAVAFQANNEFTPGNEYKTLTHGYSSMFTALFDAICKLAHEKGVQFAYQPNTRLQSILVVKHKINYTTASRAHPDTPDGHSQTDAAWLAMPRYAIELVARASRYLAKSADVLDVLNHQQVQLYLEAAILQPSYKVGMFFDTPWWSAKAATPPQYAPQLTGYELTPSVLQDLAALNFPPNYLQALQSDSHIIETPFASAAEFIVAVQHCIGERLSVKQEELLLAQAERNTIGPSVTDTPIRQVVYFGNNALDKSAKPVYGILASYDDEQFTSFWQELELGPNAQRKEPRSSDCQTLAGPRKAPEVMEKMLRAQLAAMHFGPNADYSMVPPPLETRYMDWSLPPFNAGYHAWAAHYDIADVQQKIRKPSQLLDGEQADIFIVGEAYSNDQAWVEGAYCTAESVLNEFFHIKPIIDEKDYPFICPAH